MTYELEHEWKFLLTEQEFKTLAQDFQLPNQPTRYQVNTYYDTPDQRLKDLDAALRLRNFPQESRWTLKQRLNPITSQEWHQINQEPLDPKRIADLSAWIQDTNLISFFKEKGIQLKDLQPSVQITTQRWIYPTDLGDLVLDMSSYAGTKDYELEFEANVQGMEQVQNRTKAEAYLEDLVDRYDLDPRPAPTKLKRAMDQIQSFGK